MKTQIIKQKRNFSKNFLSKTCGFTLVELIIVITILAILATIAFVSFKNYSGNARDGNRVTTLKNIEKGLELFSIKTGTLPSPETPTIFTGGVNGNLQLDQGVIGEDIAKIIQMNSVPLDPKNQSKYIYSTYGNGIYYQIGIESESQVSSFLPQTYADSTSMMVKGNYTFHPSLPSLIIGSGSELFSPDTCFVMNGEKNTLKNCTQEKNQMILKNYDSSLLGYFDMETIDSNDGLWNYLKDLSGNSMNCRSQMGNILINGVNGNAIQTTPVINPIACVNAIGSAQYQFSITFKYKTNDSNTGLFSVGGQLPAQRAVVHRISSSNHFINDEAKGALEWGKWYLYTLVYDGGNYKVYSNTDLIFEQNNVAVGIDMGIFFGAPGYMSYKTIDELIIHNYILSEREIAQNVSLAGF